MKKYFVFLLICLLGASAFGQTKISMRSVDKAECVKSDYSGLKAAFSFSGLEATELQSERGVFSTLTMPNTVVGGDEGAPQIPVVNQLIAVPFGATPSIRVTSYSTVDYDLEEYGIHRLSPRQPNVRKSDDTPFVYNEAAYQTRGLRSEPLARVSVDGTMRGVQVGRMSIEPVSYDPVNNKIRVFNDIKVEVVFEGADARATEDMLVRTYSPYFDVLYKQLFNGRAIRGIYEDHPDLWQAPVKMLVIANRMFENCIQDWVAWKTMKGIYVDVNYTDNIGTSADAIKSFIQNKYAQDAPTFLIIMGDKDQVAPSVASASKTNCVADLYYSSVDGDEFVDMYHSRISAETTEQMTAILNKALEYEQYTMPDPSYLNNVLLIAGADSGWGVTVGRPTIWYATNYYYNAEHGFDNVYEFSHGDYTNCYAPLSSGVGFANYTAHGSKTSWADPEFNVNNVQNLTNEHKYFLAIGNCCQSGDWGYSTTCFGEAMVRAENKGAYAYIGSCPNTTWKNDYYFGVGPTNRADGTMPSYEETGMGIYDAIWMDDVYNTVNSILYVGLLAGNAAGALGYELHSETLYYWQAYHVIGDGSIMPYRVQPTANNVSHMNILPIGMDTYEVNAVPGSYVAISKDGVLHGTALVGPNGTAQVQITPVTSGGDVTICVTAPQRIPYIATVPAAALEGAYISVESYTPTAAHVGDDTDLSITFKNVGTAATTGNTTVTLSSSDPNVTFNSENGSFGVLAANANTTVGGFSFHINSGVADGTNVTLHYEAVNDGETYEGNIVITANEAVLEYAGMTWDGGFTPGETLTLTAKFKNTGHYQATNAEATMTSSSDYITINNSSINVGTVGVNQEVSCQFNVTIAANCPETAQIPVTFAMTANGGLNAQGNETLKNACNVVFVLADKYNDGWDGNATLKVSFDDGTPDENLTVASGESPKTYNLEIGNGVHVTLTWIKGSYDGECSFTMSYEGNLTIYEMAQGTNPNSGVLYEFDCNCAIASQTFTVTATSSNTEQGTVSGGGEFSFGQTCTVTATPAEGYNFLHWTIDGTVVSTSASYSFEVESDVNLVAHFTTSDIIGGGGEETNNYLPSYNYYNHSLTEQIYTSEELGTAGLITSIAFYNGGAEKTLDYEFYMKPTEKALFSSDTDWEAVTEADKVFSGRVVMVANDWTTIVFSTPFAYDGTSNVVLVTNKSTAYTSSPHMSCLVFDAPSQAIYAYSDGVIYNPMMPPTSYGNSGSTEFHDVLSVKNQLRITKEPFTDCMAPSQLTATEVGPDFVRLSWTEYGISEQWYVIYNGTAVEADTNEDFILEGLEPETQYTIMVRPACDENLLSNAITITTLDACPAPQNVEVNDITASAATVTWGDYNDSYVVQLGNSAFHINESFDNGIPSDWDNNSSYAWIVVNGHIQSSNAGYSNSTSRISVTMSFPADGTIEFDAECKGEGSSTYWDHCDFIIDETTQLTAGANISGWNHYIYDVTAGEHTFTWSYTKDGSVNPAGDYFAIDNVEMKTLEVIWEDPVTVGNAEHTFTGLAPATAYCARVQGICGDNTTEWSDIVFFTTFEAVEFTKEINAYTPDGGYYLLAFPVGVVSPDEVEHMLDNTYDLYAFDESQELEWINYKNPNNGFTDLVAGKGYLYANSSDVVLTFVNSLYNGNGEVTLTKTSDAETAGWNLVGNPFNDTAYINRDFYVMNNGSEIVPAERDYINPMEGVFVVANTDGETLTFSTEAPAKSSRLVVNLTSGASISSGNAILDRAILRFDEGGQLPKFQIKGNSPQLFIQQDGKDYAVVCANGAGEMPVSFKAKENGTYTLSFSSENVEFSYLHLIDILTGEDIDLLALRSFEKPQEPQAQGPASYSFEATTTDAPNRFKVVFVVTE